MYCVLSVYGGSLWCLVVSSCVVYGLGVRGRVVCAVCVRRVFVVLGRFVVRRLEIG